MKNSPLKLFAYSLLCLTGGASLAGMREAGQTNGFRPEEWTAVSDQQLDSQRGGFDMGSGLAVSFGLVRTVMVNGEMVHQSSFNLPSISQITPDQAKMASTALSDSGVIQIGPNNFVDAGALSNRVAGTLIQNSLNDQQIQSLTVINTGVNSLGLLKALNTQAVLNDALMGAIGSR